MNKSTWKQQYQCVSCEKQFIIKNADGNDVCPFCHSGNIVKGCIDEPEESKFNKGEITLEAYKVIMHDLQSLILKDDKEAPNNKYHYDLLIENLNDVFGFSEIDLKNI